MGKIERFFVLCKQAKNGFLYAKKIKSTYPFWRLSIYTRPRKAEVKLSTINLNNDLPVGVNPFGFITLVMKLFDIGYFYLEKDGFDYVYCKRDLYRASTHFERNDAKDIFDKLIRRACERDRNLHFDIVSPAIDEVKRLAEQIHEEIYHLFRFFSDTELKRLSSAMLGTSKRYNDNVVKLQQLIKRISNYNDKIGETVELIEKFEKEFEDKHEYYLTAGHYGCNSFTDGSVTYKAVLHFIEAARKGSEEYYKQHQKQIELCQ